MYLQRPLTQPFLRRLIASMRNRGVLLIIWKKQMRCWVTQTVKVTLKGDIISTQRSKWGTQKESKVPIKLHPAWGERMEQLQIFLIIKWMRRLLLIEKMENPRRVGHLIIPHLRDASNTWFSLQRVQVTPTVVYKWHSIILLLKKQLVLLLLVLSVIRTSMECKINMLMTVTNLWLINKTYMKHIPTCSRPPLIKAPQNTSSPRVSPISPPSLSSLRFEDPYLHSNWINALKLRTIKDPSACLRSPKTTLLAQKMSSKVVT